VSSFDCVKMKSVFKIGDKKAFVRLVKEQDIPLFEGKVVHKVMATFAIARDAEWVGRLFVLDMLDEREEGIGTFVNISHLAPAFLAEEVIFEAVLSSIEKNSIVCDFEARVGSRLIATGKTGQKILSKEKIKSHFETIKGGR
jgi:fluoroacetyl-CoA thioesterase